ncbi:MAG: hypothetical protein V1735_04820 [Nanoarchaeota archaeon]
MAKGASQWISWILLLFLGVILSVFMYSWISDYVQSKNQQLIQLTDTEDCEATGLSAVACQNTQTLYINATNIESLPIHHILCRIFDIYYEVESKNLNLSVKPGQTVSAKLLKSSMTKQLELIPVLRKDNSEIVCRKRMVTLTNVTVC